MSRVRDCSDYRALVSTFRPPCAVGSFLAYCETAMVPGKCASLDNVQAGAARMLVTELL